MANIPYEKRRGVYEAAINKYGVTLQLWKAVEEMAELTKEVAKYASAGETSRAALADEIADVTVMMEQLRLIFGLNVTVQDRIDFKVRRLADRIGMQFIEEG